MNPYVILAVVVAFVINGFYWHANGVNSENTRWKAKTYQELAAASEAARKQQTMWQGVVNETARNYDLKVAAGQRNLSIALDGLRDRPERPADLPATARATCADANGAELSGAHARFLSRLAALAERTDAGLEACYAVLDKVK